jgi:hypothetical protein
MTFATRLEAALGILARTGIPKFAYAPPTHRLLWRLGVEIRPPHFSGRLTNFLWLWLVSTAPLVAIALARSNASVANILDASLITLVCWAIPEMAGYEKSAVDYGLPAWEAVESPDQPFLTPPPSNPTHWLRDG